LQEGEILLIHLNPDPTPWYDSPATKIIAEFESVVTLISLFVVWYIFLKKLGMPYPLRYFFETIFKLKRYHLSCANYKTPLATLFKSQLFALRLNKILIQTGIYSGKPNSIGLDCWMLDGDVPVQETLSEIDNLIAKSFTTDQKGYYLELKTLWRRELNLTIDSQWYIVYTSSILAISGMVLRESTMHSAFLKVIRQVEHKSLRKKEEFTEQQTQDVIDFLSYLIETKTDRDEFRNLSEIIFNQGNYQITLDKKDDLEVLFMSKSVPGGNQYDF
jgi:uncharacterized phage-like protein YoqJ